MKQEQQITKLISALGNKNYHGATKYLRAIVESKIKDKIARAAKKTKLF